LGAFQWLDHQERGYELGLSGWTELVGRAEGVSWTLCNENEEGKAWDLLWSGKGCLGVLL
jgi:hypothetical protein